MEALEPKQPSADERAVVATALDYFEGWFDADYTMPIATRITLIASSDKTHS